jgi:uncharacterized membrane protein YkoI
MKSLISLAVAGLLLGSVVSHAATLISRSEAEQKALHVVGGGTITQALEEKELGRIIWSVDITGRSREYEVWLDAHTAATLRVISQPLSPDSRYTLQSQAEETALKALGGGTVIQIQRDQWKGFEIWDVTIVQPGFEFEVFLNARNDAVLKIAKFADSVAPRILPKAEAEKIALHAVGGGQVLLIVLERNDNPPVWSVDVLATNGMEYEVKVNMYTGHVTAIIVGG